MHSGPYVSMAPRLSPFPQGIGLPVPAASAALTAAAPRGVTFPPAPVRRLVGHLGGVPGVPETGALLRLPRRGCSGGVPRGPGAVGAAARPSLSLSAGRCPGSAAPRAPLAVVPTALVLVPAVGLAPAVAVPPTACLTAVAGGARGGAGLPAPAALLCLCELLPHQACSHRAAGEATGARVLAENEERERVLGLRVRPLLLVAQEEAQGGGAVRLLSLGDLGNEGAAAARQLHAASWRQHLCNRGFPEEDECVGAQFDALQHIAVQVVTIGGLDMHHCHVRAALHSPRQPQRAAGAGALLGQQPLQVLPATLALLTRADAEGQAVDVLEAAA
mmetsp:Transcript_88586/g.275608  ORF Transcript_88586/g.275608 Transcript_88586/m.275608 type:complete len:332 (-) Transcript_88586:236-1231(-)